jgi:hypothetical protein
MPSVIIVETGSMGSITSIHHQVVVEIRLFKVGEKQWKQAAPSDSLCSGERIESRCWKSVVSCMKIVKGKCDLLQIVAALHSSCGFSCCLNRWQKEGDQHADDRNDDE